MGLLIEQNFPAIAIHRGMAQEEPLSLTKPMPRFLMKSRTDLKLTSLNYRRKLIYHPTLKAAKKDTGISSIYVVCTNLMLFFSSLAHTKPALLPHLFWTLYQSIH